MRPGFLCVVVALVLSFGLVSGPVFADDPPTPTPPPVVPLWDLAAHPEWCIDGDLVYQIPTLWPTGARPPLTIIVIDSNGPLFYVINRAGAATTDVVQQGGVQVRNTFTTRNFADAETRLLQEICFPEQ